MMKLHLGNNIGMNVCVCVCVHGFNVCLVSHTWPEEDV